MTEPHPRPLKGLPRRREIAALYILYKQGPMELGEAIKTLSETLCKTRRTSHNIIKRLRKLGLVTYQRSNDKIIVVATSPERLVEAIAIPYIRRLGGDEEGCTR